MFGEGDKADREMARQAYNIVRGSSGSVDLPHWDNLPDAMREAFQFCASHAVLNERSECAQLVRVYGHGFPEAGVIEARIRERT
jgi:hypothetical protein